MGSFRVLNKLVKKRHPVISAGAAGISRKPSFSIRPPGAGLGSYRSVAENQGRVIRLFRLLQRKKAHSLKVTLDGLLGLGIISCVLGLATLIIEATMMVKHPTASAALLSIENAGLVTSFLALFNGTLGILLFKLSRTSPRPCLTKAYKSFLSITITCSFILFALCLIAVGIFGTLRDWQHKLQSLIRFQQDVVKMIGQDELSWPEGVLEEIYTLKMMAMNCHLLIFITSGIASVFCAVNLFVMGLPDYGACADAIGAAYKKFKLPG